MSDVRAYVPRGTVAKHEAGHAIVTIALGGSVASARLDTAASGETTGEVEHMLVRGDVKAYATLIAGAVAQVLAGERVDEVLPHAADHDFIAARGCNLSRRDARTTCEDVAEILTRRWSAVRRVARELSKSGRLDGAEVARIVRTSPPMPVTSADRRRLAAVDWSAIVDATTKPERVDRTGRVVRLDFVQLDAPVQVGNSMRFTGRAASSAPMTYMDADGSSHVETRGPEVIPDVVKQLPGVPIAFEHPRDDRMYADGTTHPVSGRVVSAKLDTDAAGTQYAIATFDVTDPKLLKAIKRGPVRQLSLGYRTDIGPDGRQTDVVVDHLACVEAGRCAGGQCSIRADRHDCSCTSERKSMKSPKKPRPRLDLATAEEAARQRSARAYQQTPSRFSAAEILRRRDAAAALPADGFPPPLRTAKDPETNSDLKPGNEGLDDAQRNAKQRLEDKARGTLKGAAAGGPYRSPDVEPQDASDDGETASMDLRIAEQRSLDRSRTASLEPDPRWSREAILARQGRR